MDALFALFESDFKKMFYPSLYKQLDARSHYNFTHSGTIGTTWYTLEQIVTAC